MSTGSGAERLLQWCVCGGAVVKSCSVCGMLPCLIKGLMDVISNVLRHYNLSKMSSARDIILLLWFMFIACKCSVFMFAISSWCYKSNTTTMTSANPKYQTGISARILYNITGFIFTLFSCSVVTSDLRRQTTDVVCLRPAPTGRGQCPLGTARVRVSCQGQRTLSGQGAQCRWGQSGSENTGRYGFTGPPARPSGFPSFAALFSRVACAPLNTAVFCSRIPLASFFSVQAARGHRPKMRSSGVKLPLTPSVHFLITVYGENVIAASVV